MLKNGSYQTLQNMESPKFNYENIRYNEIPDVELEQFISLYENELYTLTQEKKFGTVSSVKNQLNDLYTELRRRQETNTHVPLNVDLTTVSNQLLETLHKKKNDELISFYTWQGDEGINEDRLNSLIKQTKDSIVEIERELLQRQLSHVYIEKDKPKSLYDYMTYTPDYDESGPLGILSGLSRFADTHRSPIEINVEQMWKNIEESRKDDAGLNLFKDGLKFIEAVSSVYTLGHGIANLGWLNKLPKLKPVFMSNKGFQLANWTGIGADALQTITSLPENNVGGIVDNSAELTLSLLGQIGYADLLRKPGIRLRKKNSFRYKLGTTLDNTFDTLPYVQSAYDLTKDTWYPSLETIINK